jgi:Uma2 family endonuclease
MSAMPGSDRVKPQSSGVKLTYDDFVLFPDDGKRHELIDGEHYVTASPNTRHQQILARLHLMIGGWLESHRIGQTFFAPYDIVLTNIDIVEPDLMYFSNARAAEVLTDLHARGAPELVVEVGSPGTRKRDETIKRRLYQRQGVSEYWIVDPKLEVVRVFRREGLSFGRVVELTRESGDTLTTPLLPGLQMPLSKIFER